MPSIACPACFIVAPASGQGKTTVSAALARYHRSLGREVRVFKTGPDYLDPQILEQACGHPVVQLDSWMAGEAYCRHKLYQAAQLADLILVEGAMGLYDGEPSSADLAAAFGIPVVIVLDVRGMAQTAAAVAVGLARFRNDLEVLGVVANQCAGGRHKSLIREHLPAELPLLATFRRDPDLALPQRHLGLVQPSECPDEIDRRIDRAAAWIADTRLADLPPCVVFEEQPVSEIPKLLDGKRIGIAQDAAFSFIYEANLELLCEMGACLSFFSPLDHESLPDVDALWLPGGYPELHAAALAENRAMLDAIRAFHESRKPILAECGGLLYCLESLIDLEGRRHTMAGLLKGQGAMSGKRGCQGLQTAVFPEGEIRGHAHHRSVISDTHGPISFCRRQRHPAPGEVILREGALTASYLHLFFPSNPESVARLLSGVPA